jgi:protein-S-isoprenylcysteine O-methyltransferase Ste14
MPHWTIWQFELLPWYAFIIVWVIGAFRLKPAKTTESAASRAMTTITLAAAFFLLFSTAARFGILGLRIFPEDAALAWMGVADTSAGAAIAIWARCILGGNWSSIVSLKAGHELIRKGPYAYVRHPIYTGILVAAIGTAIVVGEWRGVFAIVLAAIGLWFKAKREERFLTTEFGDRYVEYRQNTGALLPRFNRPGAA